MTILGISVYIWAIYAWSLFYFLVMIPEHDRLKRRAQKSLISQKRIVKEIAEKVFNELPPAYRAENWMRNIYGEPTDPKYILASTGCELTDAIFAAADEAGINIQEFYAQFEPKIGCLDTLGNEHVQIHCNDSCSA